MSWKVGFWYLAISLLLLFCCTVEGEFAKGLFFFLAKASAFHLIQQDKGRPLPKFGEWDVNDPASAEGFTAIFNKARDEKKTGGNTPGRESPGKADRGYNKRGLDASKPPKKWCCCIQASPTQS